MLSYKYRVNIYGHDKTSPEQVQKILMDALSDSMVDVVEEESKPVCKLLGEDNTMYKLVCKVKMTLSQAGKRREAREFERKVYSNDSFYTALRIANEYVEFV